MATLAQQETTRAEKPARSRKLNDLISLALMLTILVRLWINSFSFGDAVDVSIAVLAAALGLNMIWRYREYIPRIVMFVMVLPGRHGANGLVLVIQPRWPRANGRETKWPLQ